MPNQSQYFSIVDLHGRCWAVLESENAKEAREFFDVVCALLHIPCAMEVSIVSGMPESGASPIFMQSYLAILRNQAMEEAKRTKTTMQ